MEDACFTRDSNWAEWVGPTNKKANCGGGCSPKRSASRISVRAVEASGSVETCDCQDKSGVSGEFIMPRSSDDLLCLPLAKGRVKDTVIGGQTARTGNRRTPNRILDLISFVVCLLANNNLLSQTHKAQFWFFYVSLGLLVLA